MLVKASRIFGLIQKKLDKLNAVFQENLTGIRVDGGCIADVGTHEQLLQSSAIYRDIYDSQSGQGGIGA